MVNNCLFCNIEKGVEPAHRIGEKARHLTFLITYPNTRSAATVITKLHHENYVLAADDTTYTGLLLYAREMGKIDS